MSEHKQGDLAASRDAAPTRRDFIRIALAALPTTGLLAGCATGPDAELEAATYGSPVLIEGVSASTDCSSDELHARRARVQLHDAHIGCENLHDLSGISESFGAEASMVVNERKFSDARSIADAHVLLGMSSGAGGLSGTQVVPDREFLTDNELLVHGRVLGTHVGQVLHFSPTFKQVEMHYAAFYRFDDAGKLVSERIVMNWAPLAGA